MTSTERLRALLDERGVEWETDRSGFRVMWGKPVDEFHDMMQFKAVDNALPNGGLNVHICGFTPEQAIAATVGEEHETHICKRCGVAYELSIIDKGFGKPRFCPNCGARRSTND